MTRFVINPTGRVTNVDDAGSDLEDARVVTCVNSVFKGLEFPRPEGGSVSAVYPLVFSPE